MTQYPGPQHPQDIAVFPDARFIGRELNRFDDKNVHRQESIHQVGAESLSSTERRTRLGNGRVLHDIPSLIFIRLSHFRTPTTHTWSNQQGC